MILCAQSPQRTTGDSVPSRHAAEPIQCAAPGDGTIDATNAIQACIDAGGMIAEHNPFLKGAPIVIPGGTCIYVPPGKYRITKPLIYYSASCITGSGDGTEFIFSPKDPHSNFLQPDSSKVAWGHMTDTLKLKNFLAVAINQNANDGLHLDNTSRIFAEGLNIVGFHHYNISITQSAANHSGSFYNMLLNDRSFNAGTANLLIDTDASSTQIVGGVYRDSPDAPFKDFNVITKSQAVSMFGPSLEGNVRKAQVYAGGPTSIYGCYDEVPAGGHAPVVLADMAPSTHLTGGVAVSNCLMGGGVSLEGWNITSSDTRQTVIQAPNMLDAGNPKWQDLIENGSFEHGTYKWGQLNNRKQGTLTADTGHTYNSSYSLLLKSDSMGDNSAYYTIPGAQLTRYVGRRLYFTFLVHVDKSKQTITLGDYGAGNTTSKLISRPQVNLGDGWKLWVIDYPVIHASDLTIYLNQADAVRSAEVYIGAVNAYLDGYEVSPSNRESITKYRCTEPPMSGIWTLGDICWNSNPQEPNSIGYWINVASGSPGKWAAK